MRGTEAFWVNASQSLEPAEHSIVRVGGLLFVDKKAVVG